MFWLNWDFALVAVGVTPFLLLFVDALQEGGQGRDARGAQEAERDRRGRAAGAGLGALGQRVRPPGPREASAWTRPAARPSRPRSRRGASSRCSSPVVSVVVALCTAFVLWRGTALIIADVMTVGALTVFLAYLHKFFKPVQDLAKMTNTIAQTAVGLERIKTILVGRRHHSRERRMPIAPPHVQGRDRLRARRVRVRRRHAGAEGRELHDQARPDGRRRRRDRQRQVDDREPHSALLRRRPPAAC